jgi:3',5'-cyclic AMP phosphodiesterase CpdA
MTETQRMERGLNMFLTIRSKESMAVSAALVCLFFFGALCPVQASDPHCASYSTDSEKIFWFVQTSDVHIGARGYPGSENLEWLVTEAKNVIKPSFIVVTGDLTDSSDRNEMGYPDGPHIEEWEEYWDIVNTDGINPDFYYDLPGNHDHFDDENFDYYLSNSIQGLATGQTQFSWTRTFDFGTYHFLGINTCGNDGAEFSMLPPTYGDNAGLDTDELKFIADDLEDNKNADLTMIFGHHLIVKRETDWSYLTGDALEEMTMTALIYGADAFTALMEYYHPLMYAYGHSHVYREEFFIKDMTEGVIYLNVASLSKNDEKNYNIIAIDNNGISTTPHTVGVWPAVIITAPLDRNLGMENNPYTADVEDLTGTSTPIRALVFDTNPVTRVDYRMYKITEDVGDIVGTGVGLVGGLVESEDMWCPMTQVAPSHPSYPYLWVSDCPNPLEGGDYTIEVRATGSSVQRDAVPTAFPADPVDDEGLCFITSAGSGR